MRRGRWALHAGRGTNLGLLALLSIAAVTGGVAFAIGATWVRWVVVAHGVAGLGIVTLAPWKTAIAVRGLHRHRRGRIPSIVFAILVAVVVITGLTHATGLAVSIGPVTAMQVHVGAALATVALAVWHVLARRTPARRTDLSRRNLLRSGVMVGGAAFTYGGIELASRLTGLAGAERRSTGSYERSSFDPAHMPVTQWLNDAIPNVDPERWRLSVADGRGERTIAYGELLEHRARIGAILDCTGGWWSRQSWEGVVLDELLSGVEGASSIEVTSLTGYGRRLPAADAGRLLLATRVGGGPLSSGHGFPVRLVAPGRRGFWWVKWVDRVALSETPWWWQAPFPTA